MPAHRSNRRRRGGHAPHAEHENEERWLLTYADMITLLMTLFMVLFAISSVNTSKWDALSRSLNEAFSGQILSGGKSIQQTGASSDHTERAAAEPPVPAIQPVTATQTAAEPGRSTSGAAREQADFEALKRQVDQYAADHGLQGKMETRIDRKGLVIRLLTDGVLFSSGSAALHPAAAPVLGALARMLAAEVRHPIGVEGHTDAHPIASARFPDNWELSTARATQVVRFLIGHRVAPRRLEASGVAAERPLASNQKPGGRARNRRVEIVLHRQNRGSAAGSVTP
jgi:chemotaxis protein MotB